MLLPEQIDPFSISAVKAASAPAFLPFDLLWEGLHYNKTLESETLQLSETKTDTLPRLQADVLQLNLEDVPLPDLSSSQRTSDSENDYFQSLDGDSEEDEPIDVWVLPDIQKRRTDTPLASWDTFLDRSYQEPRSGYLSERQPAGFSGILEIGNYHAPRYVKPDVLLRACLVLCMGQDSALFAWEEDRNTFAPQWQNITTNGYSRVLVQRCFDEFADLGSRIKIHGISLQALEKTCFRLSPTQIALLSAFRSILDAISRDLYMTGTTAVSLIQLKARTAKVSTIVDVLDQVSGILERVQEQCQAVRDLVEVAATVSIIHPPVTEILQLLVTRASQPLLAHLGEQIGLDSSPSQHSSNEFLETSPSDGEHWETLLDLDFTEVIRGAQQSLKLLKKYAPDCFLLSTSVLGSSPLTTLDLGFTFEDISDLQSRAIAYEDAMKALIVSAESSTTTSVFDTPTSETFTLGEAIAALPATANPFRLEMDLFDHETYGGEGDSRDELQDQVLLFLESPGSQRIPRPVHNTTYIGARQAALILSHEPTVPGPQSSRAPQLAAQSSHARKPIFLRSSRYGSIRLE
jgi:hypothetical protein